MALVDTQEVALAISAKTLGGSDVAALAAQMEALAAAGGDAAPEFARLGDELRKLDAQRLHIDGLQEAIANAKLAWTAFRDAREQVAMLDRQLADARGAGANREAIRLLETELRKANLSLANHEKAWNRQKTALTAARAETAAAGVDTRNLGNAQEALAAGLERTRNAVTGQIESVNRARQAEAARAREAKAQADEEQRLAAIVTASKQKLQRAAQEQLQAEKRAYAEAQEAAKRYAAETRAISDSLNRAFSTIGIRSSQTIRAEIAAINQGLMRLANDAKVTGGDFDRAFAKGAARINELEAELKGLSGATRGAVDPFTASVGRATGGIGALLTKLGPVAGTIAAAFSVDRVARAVAEFDALNRTFTAITGGAEAAGRELSYITATAQRLGLELGSASKAYAQFMTVTRGTKLEGQGARDVFEAVAGSMAKLGKSAADTDGALLALSQMVSKGVVSMEELRQQLAERLPGAMKAAAEGAGLTEAELIKMVESGQVLAEDLLPAMAARLRELYGTEGEIKGYTSSWNKLTNAFKEAFGVLGQTRAVSDSVNGGLWVLTKTVQGLGLVVTGAAEAISLLGVSIGSLAGAVSTGNFSGLKDAIADAAVESGKRLQELQDRFLGVEDASTRAGNAAASAAQKAMAGNPGWLAVSNAYAKVNDAAEAFVKQSEKALQARQAEAAAALQFAQLSGTELDVRRAQAEGAAAVAAASDQLAAAKAAELATLQSQLAAQQQVIAATADESSAKQKLIQETRTRIAQLSEEADRQRAAADAARLDAAARQASAQAVADNSARLAELRTEYQAAAENLAFMVEMERVGVESAEAVLQARERATRAGVLYNDAIADTIRKLKDEQAVKSAASSTEERLAQLKREQARTSAAVANALGNERAAVWANVEAKRQEANITKLRAAAAVQEAQVSVQAAQIKLEEAQKRGEVTQALEQELRLAQESLKQKILEQQISAELVKQLNAEADALIRNANLRGGAGDGLQKVAEGGEQAGQGMQKVAQGTDAASDSMEDAVSIITMFANLFEEVTGRIADYSKAAAAAIEDIGNQTNGFDAMTKKLRALGGDAQKLVAEDPLGELRQDMDELSAAAEKAATEAEHFTEKARFAGNGWGALYRYTAELYNTEAALARARAKQAEFAIEVEQFNETIDDGTGNMRAQEDQLRRLIARAEELGAQELPGLRSALADVQRRLQDINEDTRSVLDTINDELDEQEGRFEDIARRRWAARREELEQQRADAERMGADDAVANIDKALRKLDQIEARKVEEARQREQEERARKARENSTKTDTSSSQQSSARGMSPVTHSIRFEMPDGKTKTVTGLPPDAAEQLISMFEQFKGTT